MPPAQLDSMYGSSDAVPLVADDDTATFTPSSCRDFRIKASDIGTITSMGVKVVSEEAAAGSCR